MVSQEHMKAISKSLHEFWSPGGFQAWYARLFERCYGIASVAQDLQ